MKDNSTKSGTSQTCKPFKEKQNIKSNEILETINNISKKNRKSKQHCKSN